VSDRIGRNKAEHQSKDPALASSFEIVAIGASAGGIEALTMIIGALPWDFAAAVFVTLHIGANSTSLPWILQSAGSLAAVAPPDHHMMLETGRKVRLTQHPHEIGRVRLLTRFFGARRAHTGAA
jgi:CheB methylesterase